MSLEQQLTDAIAAQNNLTQAVVSWKGRIEAATAAQKAAFEEWRGGGGGGGDAAFAAWRNQVFRQVTVTTELHQYRTILRVTPLIHIPTCLFRLSIAGIHGDYVFGGIFDVAISCHAHIAVSYAGAHSAYGGLALRIKTPLYPEGATIEIMRTSGHAGLANLSATITPYAGTIEVFTGSALAAPAATFEQTYS